MISQWLIKGAFSYGRWRLSKFQITWDNLSTSPPSNSRCHLMNPICSWSLLNHDDKVIAPIYELLHGCSPISAWLTSAVKQYITLHLPSKSTLTACPLSIIRLFWRRRWPTTNYKLYHPHMLISSIYTLRLESPLLYHWLPRTAIQQRH